MRNKFVPVLMLAGFLLAPGLARAEMLSGTIQSIDPVKGQFTLLRSDTRENVIVVVKDRNELADLKAGNQITVDANKKLFGGWEKTPTASANDIPQPEVTSAAMGAGQ